MGPGQDRTRDPWNCSQTRICSQTRYRLRYATRSHNMQQTKFWISKFKRNMHLKETINMYYKAWHFLWIACWCRLLITFANSLDPDQARQNVGSDLDLNCLRLRWYSWKNFSEKMNLKKNQQMTKKQNYPEGKELTSYLRFNSACWVIFMLYLSSADFFFQNQPFWKILSGTLSECQIIWIQIRPNFLLGLIRFQTVYKN